MKRVAALLLVTAVAGVIATSATAGRPDDNSGLQGTGRAAAVLHIVSGDDSGRARGPGAINAPLATPATAVSPRADLRPDDRAAARGPGAISPQTIASGDGGFDWTWSVPLAAVVALLASSLVALTLRRFRAPVAQ